MSGFQAAWPPIRKYTICKKLAVLTLPSALFLCSSSSEAQRLTQIKLSFNEHKEVQKMSLGKKGTLRESERETQEDEKNEVKKKGDGKRNVGVLCCFGKTERSEIEYCVNLSLQHRRANTPKLAATLLFLA